MKGTLLEIIVSVWVALGNGLTGFKLVIFTNPSIVPAFTVNSQVIPTCLVCTSFK